MRNEETHLFWAKKLSMGRGSKFSDGLGLACLFRMRCVALEACAAIFFGLHKLRHEQGKSAKHFFKSCDWSENLLSACLVTITFQIKAAQEFP